MSLRDQIFDANDLKTKVVPVKEWDLEITVRELSGGQRDEVFRLHDESADINAVCRTIELGAIDESGNRIFEDGDAEKLAGKSDAALTTLYSEIMKLSGCDVDSTKGETEAGKPSEKIQSSGENTDSCTSSELEPTQS
jgi:hypothetical protein